ncbi:MAG TPA: polysaccharide deacetylase family protein [Candidatus Binataceae bacterium]|nr:polysaccharide deacetylase family protein [Candidatus Binataceae bacterium]
MKKRDPNGMSDPRDAAAAMDSEAPRLASRLLKFSIGLVFYAVIESWRAVRRMFGRTAPPSAVVIYYHHVPGDQREKFSRQLDHLMRWTRPLAADFNAPLTPNVRYSIVTVDDGWKSFADNAVPELERRKIPVAMFAISERLGRSIDGIAFDRLVTPDELRALTSRGVTVGSHTATHARMTSLSAQDASHELCDSRSHLAAVLGHDVTMFCFPYGAYSDALIPLCREAGYDRVFTCLPEPVNQAEFVVGRVRVDPTDWPLEFHLKLMGAYRWLPMAIALKRRMRAALRGGSRADAQSPGVPAA